MERISIIVPTLNEEKLLGATLASIPEDPSLESIVVDGGSEDRTLQVASGARASIVLQTASRRARQMNEGARAASGDILLFLHADTRLPDGFADLVRTTLRDGAVAAGAFRLAIDSPTTALKAIERLANWRSSFFQLPYGDQALFVRRERFFSVGGYPDLPIMEDFELVRRLRRMGRIRLLSEKVLTSSRRWDRVGLLRTTLINQAVLLAYLAKCSPKRIARWY